MLIASEIEHIDVVHSANESTLNTLILSRQDLEQSFSQLSDVVASLPGIQIRRGAGFGGRTQVSVRGSNSQQVNLYIDGQLINSGQSGSFDLDQLPISLIESVEIYQGQSSGFGATPVGGEIRITTIKPDDRKVSLSVSAGTLGYLESNIKYNTQFNNHQLLTSINYLTSENDYEFLVPQPFNDSQNKEVQKLKNNRFEKLSTFLNHEWEHALGNSTSSFQFNLQKKHFPNYQNNTPENDSVLETKKYQLSNAQIIDISKFDFERLYSNISISQIDEKYYDLPTPLVNDIYNYQTQKAYLGVRLPFQFQQWRWQPFINYNYESFESESQINGLPPSCNGIGACDVKSHRNDLNIGHRLSWKNPNLDLAVAWSASQTFSENSNVSRNNDASEPSVTNDDYFSQELNVEKRWGKHRLSAQFTNGVRKPNMYELFGNRGLFKGNDNLEPEESEGFSISARNQLDSFTLEHSLYSQQISNAIVAIYSSSGAGSYQNVSNVSLLGLTSNINWDINENTQVGSTIDLIDSNTESLFRAFDNKHQPGIYHKELDVYFKWQFSKRWWFKLNHYIGTDLYYDRANKVTSNNGLTSEQHTSNISINYELDRLNFNGRINNLFNHSYKDLSNRPAQGRQIQFTLNIKEF